MKVTDITNKENLAAFTLSDASPAYANAIRRSVISLVPTLAIETVEVVQNTSALYDEVLAHRLGLLPLTTDLQSYKLGEEITDDVFRPESQVRMTLAAKGPCVVLAEEMVSSDKTVKCAVPKMPVVKLLEGQEIELSIIAQVGQGIKHMKWSAGNAYYQKAPVVKDGTKKTAVKSNDTVEAKSAEVFITEDGVQNSDITAGESAEIIESDSDLIFTVESWGQSSPKDMLVESINQLNTQLDEVSDAVKALK